jgi:hypothetical protein
MYSGVGILLEEPLTTIPRYEEEIPRLEQEARQYTRTEDEWLKKNKLSDIGYTKDLLKRLSQQANECASGTQYYRRTGAVLFEDVGEVVWQDLMSGKESRFWLI